MFCVVPTARLRHGFDIPRHLPHHVKSLIDPRSEFRIVMIWFGQPPPCMHFQNTSLCFAGTRDREILTRANSARDALLCDLGEHQFLDGFGPPSLPDARLLGNEWRRVTSRRSMRQPPRIISQPWFLGGATPLQPICPSPPNGRYPPPPGQDPNHVRCIFGPMAGASRVVRPHFGSSRPRLSQASRHANLECPNPLQSRRCLVQRSCRPC